MKDFVSRHWISVVAALTTVSVVCAMLAPQGFAWAGLAGLSLLSVLLTLTTVAWTVRSSQLTADVVRSAGRGQR